MEDNLTFKEEKMDEDKVMEIAIDIAKENYSKEYDDLSEDLQSKVFAQAEEEYYNRRANEAEIKCSYK